MAELSVHVPNMTLFNDLFIALHIMYERMAPDDPINEPTIVNMGLESMNPYAHKAQPE